MMHATLHWTVCYDQACQTHRYKEYNITSRAHNYECAGSKLSWKECTKDGCKGHVKPKIRNHWFPQPTQERCKAINHNACRNNMCQVHLAGKQESRVFPGPHMARFKEQIEKEQGWTDCKQDAWTLCFSPECRRHLILKLEAGYMPTSLFLIRKAYMIYAKEEAKNS